MSIYKRKYTGADRKEDAKKLRRLNKQLRDGLTMYVSCWENGEYEEAAALLPTIEKSWSSVKSQAEGMVDWQRHGVLCSYAD